MLLVRDSRIEKEEVVCGLRIWKGTYAGGVR